MRYEVIIYWSDEDQAFIAEVPELPGCMADGPTKAKALAAVEDCGGMDRNREVRRQTSSGSTREAYVRVIQSSAAANHICDPANWPTTRLKTFETLSLSQRWVDSFFQRIGERARIAL